jgi:hypothetical protein
MHFAGRVAGRLMGWAAIVIPLIFFGVKILEVTGWDTPAALSYPPGPNDLHDTFIPTPNQPPVFTRGSGTR